MRRWLIFFAIISLVAAGFALAAIWLFSTPEGARWLMGAFSRFTPVQIDARRVAGHLGKDLRMEGIRVRWPQGEMEAESFQLRWQPLFLLTRKLAVDEWTLQGVRIRDNRPESQRPTDLKWPKSPALLAWVSGEVKTLKIDKITYYPPDRPPSTVENFFANLHWNHGLLAVKQMFLKTQQGIAEGTIEVAFVRPSFYLNLALKPAKPLLGLDALSVSMRLLPARHPEQVAGKMTLEGRSGSVRLLMLEGNAGVTRHTINFRRLILSQPGRQGMITGEGRIAFAEDEPLLRLKMKLDDLNLSKELIVETALSGTLEIEGHPDHYRGKITIRNKKEEWRSSHLSGSFIGNLKGMQLDFFEGALLDGTLRGHLQANWERGFSISGNLEGRDLNPARITPEWQGQVNLNLEGALRRTEMEPVEAKLKAHLLDSLLRGKALTGEAEAYLKENTLTLAKLKLRGNGFDLFARGRLQERLNFRADISDLTGLIPGIHGNLFAEGWARWRKDRLSGAFIGRGRDLFVDKIKVASLDLSGSLEEEEKGLINLRVNGRKIAYDSLHVDSAKLVVTGTATDHHGEVGGSWPGGEVQATFEGGYDEEIWRGTFRRLSGKDVRSGPWKMESPVTLNISQHGFKMSPLVIIGPQRERLQLATDLLFHPIRGMLNAEWQQIDLARANPWLGKRHLTGNTTGKLQVHRSEGEHLQISARVDVAGTFTDGPLKLELSRGLAELDWNERGLIASWELEDIRGGRLHGNLSSPQPARGVLPAHGKLDVRWEAIDLGLLRPWMPQPLVLEGRVSGMAEGQWLAGARLDVKGEARISRGSLTWREKNGLFSVRLKTADLNMAWREETLSGHVSFVLEEYGHLKGVFSLPLPARLPPSVHSTGPLHLSLQGQAHERGLLTTLFPGLIRESTGELEFKVQAGGRLDQPRFEGNIRLTKAGAYLPSPGIHLSEVTLEAAFTEDRLHITSFRTHSGPGHLEGTAIVRFEKWKVSQYEGSIKGAHFQTIYLPELQALSSPHLNFQGTGEKFSLRGEIRLPEVLISGDQKEVVRPSPDVIIVDAKKEPEWTLPIALDIQVQVLLGDSVWVKAQGIDVRLSGGVTLNIQDLQDIKATGEIRVVQGHYSIYAKKLEITRGRLLFKEDPVDRPTLDILALRKIGDIQAGVLVTGTPQTPIVRLYSRPPMQETDILSYIVLGQPLSTGKEQAPSLMQAAAALLSAGESVILQGKLKTFLGLDTLDIQPEGDEVSRSVVTIGKYLTPKLYLSLGRSLFTEATFVTLRYSLSRRLEIETRTGTESGANLYYRIEFR